MKISVDDQELFTLSETQKQVIKNDIHEDIFEDDMKRRLQYILNHKYERCMIRLKNEWVPKLKESGEKSIPLDDDAFASLVFSHPEYKDRKSRDLMDLQNSAQNL
jgi:hypothetical protein